MSTARGLRVAAYAIALMTALPLTAGADGERTLSLDQALHMAVERNEDILIQRQSLAAADATVSSSRGAYDPVLTLGWGWRRTTEPLNTVPFAPEGESAEVGVGIRQLLPYGGSLAFTGRGGRGVTNSAYALLSPAFDTRVGVELRQPLMKNLAIDQTRLAVRVTQADRRGAKAALRQVESEAVAATEQAYWALAAARMGLDVREEAVRLAEKQLEETRTRVQTGIAPGTELAQPRAELERRRGELLATRETVSRAENTLKVLILADDDEASWTARFIPTDSVGVNLAPPEVESGLQRALATRPELDQARSVVERRRAETAYARNGTRPGLDAVLAYDRFGVAGSRNPLGSFDPQSGLDGGLSQSFGRLGDGDLHAARLALVLELPIPNRSAHAEVEQAQSVERQAGAELTRARKAVRAEVLDAMATLETAGQRIEAARAGRQAAEVQLAAVTDQYLAGLSTNFLVLTRQNDLSRARLDEISALADYRRAQTEVARATGSLMAERGIQTRDRDK